MDCALRMLRKQILYNMVSLTSWHEIEWTEIILMANVFRKHLLVTNLSVSFGLSAIGDYIQQKYENHKKSVLVKEITA